MVQDGLHAAVQRGRVGVHAILVVTARAVHTVDSSVKYRPAVLLSVQFSFFAVPPRSLHHRLDGRLRSLGQHKY